LKAPPLDPNNDLHAIKCGRQILNSSFVLAFELIEVPLEVSLCSADLLRKQIGPVLQVATDVAHLMIPPGFATRSQTIKPHSRSGPILRKAKLRNGVTLQQRSFAPVPGEKRTRHCGSLASPLENLTGGRGTPFQG